MSRSQGKPPTQRQLRIGEEIRHALAAVLERGELRDPEIANRAITVTEVRISPDLKHATAFIVPLGGGDATPSLAGLKRARAYLRHELSKMINLRYCPDVTFQADATFDEASRINMILYSPEVRRDIDKAADAVDDEGPGDMAPEGRNDGA